MRSGPVPIVPLIPPPSQRRPSRWRFVPALAAGIVMVAFSLAGGWAVRRHYDGVLTALDERALGQAEAALGAAVEAQRQRVLSEIKLLVDDPRIRATVITPNFDEATVRDVMDDIRRACDATAIAVLDVSGKVKAATSGEALRSVDLDSAAALHTALEQPTSYVWTFPDRVLVVAVAPIRQGDQVAALLVMGLELGQATLAAVERAFGVAGALFVGERVVASGSTDPSLAAAFAAARAVGEGVTMPVSSGREMLARASRTSASATAGRVVWLVPRHQQAALLGVLPDVAFAPAGLVAMTLVLTLVLGPSSKKGGLR
jgi:hypothetical protein